MPAIANIENIDIQNREKWLRYTVLCYGASHHYVILYPVYTLKQTWSKLRAHVVHVYLEYVCFIFASCLLYRENGVTACNQQGNRPHTRLCENWW